ncbi:hypothetical protein BGX26_007392 [Mortierella sp. AD094]|nr:hypothetical protein BGX26_007392 [Mortierella sp. AD094]
MDQEIPRKLNKTKCRWNANIIHPEQIQPLRPELVDVDSLYCIGEGSTKRKREVEDKFEPPRDVLLQPTENVPIQLMKRQRACSSESVDTAAPPPPPVPATPPRRCTFSSDMIEMYYPYQVDVRAEWGATTSFQAESKAIWFISIRITVLKITILRVTVLGYVLDPQFEFAKVVGNILRLGSVV